jgi:hypothetical protein
MRFTIVGWFSKAERWISPFSSAIAREELSLMIRATIRSR